MKIFKFLLLFLVVQVSAQQGGMWIPSLLEGMNEKEMKSLGSQLSAKDIYDVNNSSLKDAIVHFNGGCTSEIISDSGLLLTNHHCGYGAIQSHSSVEHDYLQDGFWAKTMKDELPNKGMVATLIVRIEDVTNDILKNVPSDASLTEQQNLISQHIEAVTKGAKKESWQDARVKSMYDGNQYMLFITETFKDIRLVGAPPTSIGKFGSDTDNWMWPRHTGDFSL
ncbi:MAG: S46 family peptidase, partial [Flavobacteriaceae bacterium]